MIESVVVLIGLPGSGKTTLAQSLAEPNDMVVDEFSLRWKENPVGLQCTIDTAKPRRLLITDMAVACEPRLFREFFERRFGVTDVTFIAFENDADAAWANVERRGDGRVISRALVRTLSRHYDPARYSEDVRPVYRP